MADVQHAALTDPELHEPKGASTASLGEAYVSDGAGSGSWGDASDITSTKSATSDGYVYLAGGFILQWGSFDPATTTETVTFPVAFPTSCLQVVATAQIDSDTGGSDTAVVLGNAPTTTQAVFSTTSVFDAVRWFAIGY